MANTNVHVWNKSCAKVIIKLHIKLWPVETHLMSGVASTSKRTQSKQPLADA